MLNRFHLDSFWLKTRRLSKYIFFYYLFLASCSSEKGESDKVQAFLEKILVEEGGVYTLFGSKPLTDILIFKGTERDISLKELSKTSLQEIVYVEDRTLEYFEAWKRFSKRLKFHKFRFFERTSLYDPLYTSYFFLNVERAKEVYEENREIFTRKLGKWVPFDEALKELEDPHSIFWGIVLTDHELAGLLYGYGKENVESFGKYSPSKTRFSETRKQNTKVQFPLPVYAVSENDRTTKRYREEQAKIQEIYRARPFLEVTLKRIAE